MEDLAPPIVVATLTPTHVRNLAAELPRAVFREALSCFALVIERTAFPVLLRTLFIIANYG